MSSNQSLDILSGKALLSAKGGMLQSGNLPAMIVQDEMIQITRH